MPTGINGTIKLVGEEGGQKIQLVISEDDYEEFKKYKNVNNVNNVNEKEFYARFTLNNDKQLYIIGSFNKKTEAENGDAHLSISSVGTQDNELPATKVQRMEEKLGLDKQMLEVEVIMFKHPIVELQAQSKTKTQELEAAKKEAEEKQQELQAQLNTADEELKAKETEAAKLKADLEAKEEEIAQLKQQQPDAAQLQKKEGKIKELEAKINQPNAEVNKLKTDLTAREKEVDKLKKENKELEAQNKTTEQPKQSNAARYTATVGMGLAAGLIAFTALERTVKLEMLVMVGIAVASALVVGGITYAVLPSTQVNGAKAQEVSGDEKSK